MELDELKEEGILMEEPVGYLKSKLDLQEGTLFVTPKRIVLQIKDDGDLGLSFINLVRKKKPEKRKFVFNLKRSDIHSVTEVKHSLLKYVLAIRDKQNHIFQVIVRNYKEWEAALKKNLLGD